MLVKEVMTQNTQYVSPNATLQQAACEMLQSDYGFIPVLDNSQQLVGTLCDRDITLRAVANGKDPSKTSVKEIINNQILFVFEDDDIKKAAQSMSEHHVARLVVLSRTKQVAGILSIEDLALKGKNEQLTQQVLNSIAETALN